MDRRVHAGTGYLRHWHREPRHRRQGGLLVTLFAVSYALSASLLGVLFATTERRRVLVGAMTVFAVSNLIAALSPHYARGGRGAPEASAVFKPLGAVLALDALGERRDDDASYLRERRRS